MKKFILSILAVLYLGLSSGFSVHLHYCMDKLEKWDLEYSHEPSEDACSNCGMPQNNEDDCCSVEQKLVKLDEDQNSNSQTFNFIKSVSQAGNLPAHPYLTPDAESILHHQPIAYTLSFRQNKLPLFLRYGNFRI